MAGVCVASALVLAIGNAPPVPNTKGTTKKRSNLLVTNDLHNSRDTHPQRRARGKKPTDVALFPHSAAVDTGRGSRGAKPEPRVSHRTKQGPAITGPCPIKRADMKLLAASIRRTSTRRVKTRYPPQKNWDATNLSVNRAPSAGSLNSEGFPRGSMRTADFERPAEPCTTRADGEETRLCAVPWPVRPPTASSSV